MKEDKYVSPQRSRKTVDLVSYTGTRLVNQRDSESQIGISFLLCPWIEYFDNPTNLPYYVLFENCVMTFSHPL